MNINNSFSSWKEIIAGVPQGFILEPLVFNIFINDIFLLENKALGNYADDNVLHAFESNVDEIKTHFSEDLIKISE